MTAAMEDALRDLRLREHAMKARAEASERLSDEIIASLTSGLLVVGDDRRVKSLNPAGRRLLGMPEATGPATIATCSPAPPARGVIEECLATAQPVRAARSASTAGMAPTHLGVTVSPIRDRARARARRDLSVQRPHRRSSSSRSSCG